MRWAGLLALATSGCTMFDVGETSSVVDDPDHDGFADVAVDNCPGVENPDQLDSNRDGIGDACSTYCTGACDDPLTCACADFDTSPDSPWGIVAEGAGTGQLTTGDVRSAPRALSLHVPKGLAEGNRNMVTVAHGLLAANKHIVFESDWKVSYYRETDDAHTTQFTSVFMANVANVSLGYTFDGTAGTWLVSNSRIGGPGRSWAIARPPSDEATWMRLRFDVKFDHAGAGHIYVWFNDTEVVHEDNLINAPVTEGAQSLSGCAKIWTHQGVTPDVQITQDNLVIRVD